MGYVPEKPPTDDGAYMIPGMLSANELRALRAWMPNRPLTPQPLQPMRWTCTYCKGERTGSTCEGCGAPFHRDTRDPGEPPRERWMPQPPKDRR